MNNITVKIKKLKQTAILPKRGSQFAAGYDVCACLDKEVQIQPHETCKIGTGLAIETPENYWTGIFARSGLATKKGLRPANCVGVVDSDYRGQIIVAVHNDSETPRVIEPNERIGQLIIMPCYNISFEEVDKLEDTDRGASGFGSTGMM